MSRTESKMGRAPILRVLPSTRRLVVDLTQIS
jgi:hypothetical protein